MSLVNPMRDGWERFRFDLDPEPGEMTTVRHIAHVPSARRIIEDSRIRAGLVYDESRLNKSRISVAWLSANTWGLGSIYGTVEFQFSWPDIVAGQNMYWVEAIGYRPPAFRLLLSKRRISSPLIHPYNPETDDGPLRLKDGRYFRNRGLTSEFMVEEDLLLERCTGLDFVTHHREHCSPFGAAACEDRRQQPSVQRSGSKILAYVLGHKLHVLDQHLRPPSADPLFTPMETAYSGLQEYLPRDVIFGGPLTSVADSQAAVRGALALYGMDQARQADELLSTISREDIFDRALIEIVRTHFGEPGWEPTEAAF